MLTWFRQRRRGAPRHAGEARRRRPTLEALEDRCLLAVITEFGTGITAGAAPSGIALGSDGNLWFTEFSADKIGRITPTGTVTEFALPAGSNPLGITSMTAGRLFFTENGTGKIGSIDPSNANPGTTIMESQVVPSGAGAGVNGIAVGSDGNIWFTETSASMIGTVSPVNLATATISETPTTTGNAAPAGITAGPTGDLNLYFTETDGAANRIAKISVLGMVTEFNALPLADSDPEGITAGPDGMLWFTESGENQIGRINTSGTTLTEFPLPTVDSGPRGITVGPDGALWFTETAGNRVGSISVVGVLTPEASIGITADSQPDGIVTGPDGNLWFTETAGNKIARLMPPLAADKALTATGTPVSATATVPFSGQVATLADADLTATAGSYAVAINWGDGTALDTTSATVAPVTGQPGHFTISGTHTFAAGGSDTVQVMVTDTNTTTDVGGSTATTSSPATVAAVGTKTTLTTSPSQPTVGQPVTLTATVTVPANKTVPSGTVTFSDGSTMLGTATLNSSGVATLSAMLSAGSHNLTASFSDAATFSSSTSAAVNVTVAPVTPLTGNVTSDVQTTVGPAMRVRKTKRFTETLSIKNTSTSPLQGPLNVVLKGLRKEIRVSGEKFFGTKKKKTPYVVVNPLGGALQPGATVQVTLTFNAHPNHFTVSAVFANTTPM
jgi:virginiamycin B lyase